MTSAGRLADPAPVCFDAALAGAFLLQAATGQANGTYGGSSRLAVALGLSCTAIDSGRAWGAIQRTANHLGFQQRRAQNSRLESHPRRLPQPFNVVARHHYLAH
jgi:hypothetical protein